MELHKNFGDKKNGNVQKEGQGKNCRDKLIRGEFNGSPKYVRDIIREKRNNFIPTKKQYS